MVLSLCACARTCQDETHGEAKAEDEPQLQLQSPPAAAAVDSIPTAASAHAPTFPAPPPPPPPQPESAPPETSLPQPPPPESAAGEPAAAEEEGGGGWGAVEEETGEEEGEATATRGTVEDHASAEQWQNCRDAQSGGMDCGQTLRHAPMNHLQVSPGSVSQTVNPVSRLLNLEHARHTFGGFKVTLACIVGGGGRAGEGGVAGFAGDGDRTIPAAAGGGGTGGTGVGGDAGGGWEGRRRGGALERARWVVGRGRVGLSDLHAPKSAAVPPVHCMREASAADH